MTINPGDLVVDYSFNKPTAAELHAGGVKAVCLYQPGPPKGTNAAEIAALHAGGIGIVALWETYVSRPLTGASGGTADGKAAAAAWASVGLPAEQPIVVAFDFDVTSGSLAVSDAYGRAFAAACAPYTFGVYGDADIARSLANVAAFLWQPAARAWGVQTMPHMVQGRGAALGSGVVDLNVVIVPFDAWGPPAPVPVPPQPVPVPPGPGPGKDRPPLPIVPPTTPTEAIVNQLPTLQQGSTGQPVKRVQALINVVAPGRLAEDGIFGSVTDAAVRDFQRFFGLAVDGVVGVGQTWPALLGV